MRTNAILASLALAAGLTACESTSTGAPSGEARVTVLLTDAPAELSEATVQVKQIYLVRGGAEADSLRGGRVTLFDGDRSFNLLQLQNGVTAELANVVIPAGTYSQLRMVTGDVTLKTRTGTTYTTRDGSLKCPSCASSGFKVNLAGGGVTLDGVEKLVLDFDVSQSFGHEAGRSGKWVMHPVINATRMQQSGSIAGRVSLASGVTLPACGGQRTTLSAFTPRATAGAVALSTRPDSTGAFRFATVPAGTYTMSYQDSVTYTNGNRLRFAATPSAATTVVSTGQTATVNYTISSATCATS